MNDYVSKPIDRDVLERVIERWTTGNKQMTDQIPDTPSAPVLPPPAVVGFDAEGFLDRLSGNENLARRVASRFLTDMPNQLVALAQAIGLSDGETAHREAHSVKGSAANIGAEQVREAARRLEQSAEAGDLAAAAELFPALQMSFEQLCPLLEEFCQVERN
jgi:two-component system sensor histidine kinase/response regulator